MKKLFFSMMAVAALSFGFVSCSSDDDDDDKKGNESKLELTTPAHTNDAATFTLTTVTADPSNPTAGSGDEVTIGTIEFTESGQYIAKEFATTKADVIDVVIGNYKKDGDTYELTTGDYAGSTLTVTPQGISATIIVTGNDEPIVATGSQDTTSSTTDSDAQDIARTWNIDYQHVHVNKLTVDVSKEPYYSDYFAEIGVPTQIIITKANTFAVTFLKKNANGVMSEPVYEAGTWSWDVQGASINVDGVSFGSVSYELAENMELSFKYDKYTFTVELNEQK